MGLEDEMHINHKQENRRQQQMNDQQFREFMEEVDENAEWIEFLDGPEFLDMLNDMENNERGMETPHVQTIQVEQNCKAIPKKQKEDEKKTASHQQQIEKIKKNILKQL